MSLREESRKYAAVIPMLKSERDIIDARAEALGLTRAAYCRVVLLSNDTEVFTTCRKNKGDKK